MKLLLSSYFKCIKLLQDCNQNTISSRWKRALFGWGLVISMYLSRVPMKPIFSRYPKCISTKTTIRFLPLGPHSTVLFVKQTQQQKQPNTLFFFHWNGILDNVTISYQRWMNSIFEFNNLQNYTSMCKRPIGNQFQIILFKNGVFEMPRLSAGFSIIQFLGFSNIQLIFNLAKITQLLQNFWQYSLN